MDTNLYLGLQKGRVYKDQVAEYFRGMGFSVWQLTGYHVPIDMCVWNNQVDLTVKVRFRTYQSWDYPLTS